jgi:zinc protease
MTPTMSAATGPLDRVDRWAYAGGAVTPWQPAGRHPFERAELPNGMIVLGHAQPADPAIALRLRMPVGAINDPAERSGLAAFTARMLPRGTTRRTYEQLNELTDSLGASLGVEAGRHFAELSMRCLREDLPTLLNLAAEILREPIFPPVEIEKVRQELLTAIREADNDTRATADRTLRRLLFPPPHPLGGRVSGDAASVAAMSRDDLMVFHRERYGADQTTVAVAGGFAHFPEIVEMIAARLAEWSPATAGPVALPPLMVRSSASREESTIPGKSQSDLALGRVTLSRLDPAYYALDAANLILGRLGLMGRLGANVRDHHGLAYYVFSQLEAGRESSLWVARAGVNPVNVEQAIASIINELRRLIESPVLPEELDDAKSYLTGVLPLALETNEGVVATLLNIEYYALGLDYLERFPALIDRLTPEELQTIVATQLDPDRVAIAVAGPPSAGQ